MQYFSPRLFIANWNHSFLLIVYKIHTCDCDEYVFFLFFSSLLSYWYCCFVLQRSIRWRLCYTRRLTQYANVIRCDLVVILYLFCSKYISMMRRRQWNHHQLLYLFACWLCHELASVFMNIQQRMKTKIRVICERARSNETDRLKPVQCDSHGFIWIGDVVAVVMEKWQRCRIHQWRYYEKEVEKMRMKKKDVMKRAKKKKNWTDYWEDENRIAYRIGDGWRVASFYSCYAIANLVGRLAVREVPINTDAVITLSRMNHWTNLYYIIDGHVVRDDVMLFLLLGTHTHTDLNSFLVSYDRNFYGVYRVACASNNNNVWKVLSYDPDTAG